MGALETALKTSFPDAMLILLSDVNGGKTMDGVASGGARLAEVIRSKVPAGGCLSVVGYSLGGIYARFALRMLEQEKWFDKNNVKRINFVTLASPHLGISETPTQIRVAIRLFGSCFCRSASDLALHTGVMQELVDDIALRSLREFDRRILYGNIIDDWKVRPCTALMLA